jgi:hypothetical protein
LPVVAGVVVVSILLAVEVLAVIGQTLLLLRQLHLQKHQVVVVQ